MTEEEISLVLNTFMYIDYKEADDGMTVSEILEELSRHPDCQEGGLHSGEYTVLSKAAENPEIGKLAIGNQSCLMGYDSGTAACTFATEDRSRLYVVYRGTGDGEWPDNGLGMTAKSTPQQERALDYFERVMEREEAGPGQRVIVTGHSKGGNKAQFVTMSTKYEDRIAACYSIDGQGFSESAIAGWKDDYGKEEYEERTGRITGICGENDYVNVLGNSIIPKERIRYIKTPVQVQNFAGYHDIKYMFASLEGDDSSGTVFGGTKNDYAAGQGRLGSYAAALSAAFMGMDSEHRDGCAATLMQLMELGGERKTGLNGEKLTLFDIADFVSVGIPAVADSMFRTQQGRKMLAAAFMGKTFSQDMTGRLVLRADYSLLAGQSRSFQEMAAEIRKRKEEAEQIAGRLPYFIKNNWTLCRSLKRETQRLEEEAERLEKLSETVERIVKIYMERDVQISQMW